MVDYFFGVNNLSVPHDTGKGVKGNFVAQWIILTGWRPRDVNSIDKVASIIFH